MPVNIMGRAWFYSDDEWEVELWGHEFEPMDFKSRSGADWAREHLCETYSCREVRELFNLPAVGHFQVMFKGTLDGAMSGYYEPEWDEWFEVTESSFQPIPAEYEAVKRDYERGQVT